MTIFVDMDEVLADTYGKHIELYNKEFNQNLKKEDCIDGEVYEFIPEEHRQSIYDHVWMPGFFRSLSPIPNSKEVMKELSEKHDVFVASAAMEFPLSLREKSDWLDQHFPFISWHNRILCGHKHILRGDVLIDDRERNLKSFDGRAIVFTSPHNTYLKDYERADNWEDLRKLLL